MSKANLFHNPSTLDEFVKIYVRFFKDGDKLVEEGQLLEENYYVFNRFTILRTLPIINQVEDAINYLNKTNMTQDGHIVIHSKTVMDSLDTYINMTNGIGYDINHLNDYYSYPEDFDQLLNTKILAGINNLNLWFNTREITKSHKKYTIIRKITLEYINNITPFYYQEDAYNNIYMIQIQKQVI